MRVNTVALMTVAEQCPERYPDNRAQREINLWVKTKRQVWLGLEHLSWAVAYMHDQHVLGGIPVNPSDKFGGYGTSPTVVGSSSSSSGADFSSPEKAASVRWCFRTNAWNARVMHEGALQCERFLKVADIDITEVSAVAEGVHSLDSCTYPQLKGIAYKILENWAEQQ